MYEYHQPRDQRQKISLWFLFQEDTAHAALSIILHLEMEPNFPNDRPVGQ